jgi:protein SCO1/2
MNRRTYLRSVVVGGSLASGGCLSVLGGSAAGDTVLEPPANRQFDSEELPYPAHGQALPDFTLPDPLADVTVDSSELEGTLVVTGFFAACPVECVRLIGQLGGVQRKTVELGLTEDVTFLAITFDPERDDAQRLQTFGNRMGVNLAAGNWHFLRPPTPERAEAVVDEKLGITFERIAGEKSQRLDQYDFRHISLTFLRNPAGTVERAYQTDMPDHERVLADVERVVEAST